MANTSKYATLPRAVRVDEEIHAHLKIMADRERRSITNLIGKIISDAVERDQAQHPAGQKQ